MIPVNVRILFASKSDLLTMCRGGEMLEDFYYRINDFPITIPPLRERVEDIHLLAEYFLKVFAEGMSKRVRGFSDEALSLLAGYEWPGNVRELEKIVKRAVILAEEDGVVTPDLINFDEIGRLPAPPTFAGSAFPSASRISRRGSYRRASSGTDGTGVSPRPSSASAIRPCSRKSATCASRNAIERSGPAAAFFPRLPLQVAWSATDD